MDAKRTSAEIEKQMDAERQTAKRLQAKLKDAQAEVAKAEQAQDRAAYQALAHDDKAAQKKLDDAEERLAKAERHIRSFEKAIAQSVQRFERLEAEWKSALRAEEWEKALALAAEAQEEAGKIDEYINGLTQLLGQHQAKLEELRRRSHNLGFERAFNTCGIRHAIRIMDWRLIQAGVSTEVEKPTPVYRTVKGYAEIFRQQVEAAKIQPSAQPNGQDGEIRAADPEAGAGAEASYIETRTDDPPSPVEGRMWLKTDDPGERR